MSNAVVMYTGGELVRVVKASVQPPRAARVDSASGDFCGSCGVMILRFEENVGIRTDCLVCIGTLPNTRQFRNGRPTEEPILQTDNRRVPRDVNLARIGTDQQ